MVFNFEKKTNGCILSSGDEIDDWEDNPLMMVQCHTYQLWQISNNENRGAGSALSPNGVMVINDQVTVGSVQTRIQLAETEDNPSSTLIHCTGGFEIGKTKDSE